VRRTRQYTGKTRLSLLEDGRLTGLEPGCLELGWLATAAAAPDSKVILLSDLTSSSFLSLVPKNYLTPINTH
jgi:hypothetical protein